MNKAQHLHAARLRLRRQQARHNVLLRLPASTPEQAAKKMKAILEYWDQLQRDKQIVKPTNNGLTLREALRIADEV